ncbi:MAG: PAS domain-containing protein [Deinococcota bacterium]
MSRLSPQSKTKVVSNQLDDMTAFGDANVAMLLTDDKGVYVNVNHVFTTLVGRTHYQLVGQPLTSLLTSSSQAEVAANYATFVSSDMGYYSQTWQLAEGGLLTLMTSRLAGGNQFLNVVTQVKGATVQPVSADLPILAESRAQDRVHLRALYDAMPDGVLRFDRQGICLASKTPTNFEPVVDYDGLVGQSISYGMSQADAGRDQATLEALFNTGERQTFEHSVTIAGEVFYRENRFVRLSEDEGLVIVRDITARRRAEQDRDQQQSRLQALYALLPDGVLRFDRQGVCLEVKAPENFASYKTYADTVGKPIYIDLPKADADQVQAAIDRLFISGEIQTFEHSLKINGERQYRENRFVKLADNEGIALVRDITERKRAERALEAKQAHLRALYEAIPDGIIHFDRQGICLDVKAPAMFEPYHTYHDIRQMIGRLAEASLPAEAAARVQHYREILFETGQLQHFEYSLEQHGTTRYRENDFVKLNDNEGIAVIRDISERKRREQENKTQQEHLMGLYQALPDAIIRVDRAGNYLEFKPPLNFQAAYSVEQTIDRNIRDNVSAEVAELAMHYLERLFLTAKVQRYEHSLVFAGEVRYRENRLVKLNDNEALIIVRDVTEQKRIEASAKAQQEQLIGLYEAFPDTIIRFNRAGYYLDVKPPSQTGPDDLAAEIAGRHIRDNVPEDTAGAAMQSVEQLFTTGKLQMFEYSLEASGTTYYRETRLVKLNESEGLMIIRDITERKRAEQSIQLHQARLMALYEAIPDGIAHVSRDGRFIDLKLPTTYQPYRPGQVPKGASVRDTAPAAIIDLFEDKLEQLFVTGNSQKFEYSLDIAEQPRYRECRLVKLNDNEALSIIRDLTEYKQAELASREGQARLLALYQGIPDAITWFKRDGTIIDYKKPFNYEVYNTEAVRLGRNVKEIVPPHIKELFEAKLERLFATKELQQFDYSLELAGELRYRECRLILRSDNDVLVMVRDITQQKRTESDVVAGQARLLALYQGIPDAITWFKRDGTILDHKPPSAHTPYYAVDEMAGRNMHEFAPADVLAKFDVSLAALFQHGDLQRFEYSLEVHSELRQRECRLIKLNDNEALSIVRDITEQRRTEAEVQAGQERILALYEAIPDAITWFTREGIVLDHKAALTHQVYKLEETVIGQNIRKFAPESARDALEHGLQQVFEQGNLQQFDYAFMKDGTTFYRECQLVKRNDNEALAIIRDISAYKRVEDALRAEKEQVLALYKAIPDGIMRFNQDGVYLDIKPIPGEGSHKPIADLLGHTFEENLPAENALVARRHSERLFATGDMQRFENRILVDGQVRHRETRMVKLNDNEAFAIVRDITQQKQIAQHLSNERAHLLALYEAIPDTIIRLSREGEYLSYKPAMYFEPYKDPDATLGKYLHDNVPPESARHAYQQLARLFETGDMQQFENTLSVNGKIHHRENRFVKLNDSEAIVIVRDITKQKQIAQHLDEERAHLLALYEAIPDAIIRLNREGQYLSHKPASYFKPYKDPDATLGGYLHNNAPPEIVETAYKYLARLFKTGEVQRFENTLMVDDTLRYRENRLVKLNDNEAVSIVRDLTEQKQAEQALQESKQRLDLAIEAAKLGIWDRHVDRDVARVNAHYKRIMGIPETAHVSYEAMLEGIHPAECEHVLKEFSELYNGNKPSISHERRQRHEDGSYRWLRITGSAVEWDEHSKPVRFVTVVEDIHAQKTLQLQLEQALKEKTVLLAEVHHRVKNNMQIIGSIMSLHAREAKQPEARAALVSSRTRIRTMAAIHEVMYNTEVFSDLDFSTYLQTIAHSLVQFSYRDMPSQAAARRPSPELQFELASVRLDMQDALPCALIFNELLSNALKHAFPEQGGPDQPMIHISLNQVGQQIRLILCDNGVGVSSSQKNFGSFIVDTLVEQLQGSLELSSASAESQTGTKAVLVFDKMAD